MLGGVAVLDVSPKASVVLVSAALAFPEVADAAEDDATLGQRVRATLRARIGGRERSLRLVRLDPVSFRAAIPRAATACRIAVEAVGFRFGRYYAAPSPAAGRFPCRPPRGRPFTSRLVGGAPGPALTR